MSLRGLRKTTTVVILSVEPPDIEALHKILLKQERLFYTANKHIIPPEIEAFAQNIIETRTIILHSCNKHIIPPEIEALHNLF